MSKFGRKNWRRNLWKARGKIVTLSWVKKKKDSAKNEEENRTQKSSTSCRNNKFFRTPFGVSVITFDSEIQSLWLLMFWKANRKAYNYVFNSCLQKTLLKWG